MFFVEITQNHTTLFCSSRIIETTGQCLLLTLLKITTCCFSVKKTQKDVRRFSIDNAQIVPRCFFSEIAVPLEALEIIASCFPVKLLKVTPCCFLLKRLEVTSCCYLLP